MARVRGREALGAHFATMRSALMQSVLPGAARAGARVFAEEIRANSPAAEVRDNLRIRVREDDGRVTARVDVKPGWARSVAIWLEWGTDPHLISVDPNQSGGRTVGRINRLARKTGASHESLVIGGKFVGRTVMHPGARPRPLFRPAQDTRFDDARAAAQAYINDRLARGITVDDPVSNEGDA